MPDNVVFVMDATIGQACESRVNRPFLYITSYINFKYNKVTLHKILTAQGSFRMLEHFV